MNVLPITVMGIGDVVTRRYLELFSKAGRRLGLSINRVVDLLPAEELSQVTRSQLERCGSSYLQIPENCVTNVVEFLRENNLASNPVVLATPTPTHYDYAIQILAGGMKFAIEKPFVNDCLQAEKLQSSVSIQHFEESAFLFGYYLLEKSISSLILARYGDVPDAYTACLLTNIDRRSWRQIRSDLGNVHSIKGALIEGRGRNASLNHRSWALDPRNGANTLETFYHLVCVTLPFLSPSKVNISNVELRVFDGAHVSHHQDTAALGESYTYARLSSGAIDVNLLCSKYATEAASQRWVEVHFANGTAKFNFEDCTANIVCKKATYYTRLKYPTRYETQFRLFRSFLEHGVGPELNLSRDALRLTTKIRDAGTRNKVGVYSSGDVNLEHVRSTLG